MTRADAGARVVPDVALPGLPDVFATMGVRLQGIDAAELRVAQCPLRSGLTSVRLDWPWTLGRPPSGCGQAGIKMVREMPEREQSERLPRPDNGPWSELLHARRVDGADVGGKLAETGPLRRVGPVAG